MESKTAGRVRGVLQAYRSNATYRRLLTCLALCAMALSVALLMKHALAATTQRVVLSCPFAGEAAHTHTEDCYDEQGKLVCPLAERPLHTHTAACHDGSGTLACGLDELTVEHVHGPGCFATVTTYTPDLPQRVLEALSRDPHRPAQAFSQQVVGDDGVVQADVQVDAGQGAFPAGTTMHVTPLDERSLSASQRQAVAQAVARASSGAIAAAQAVDISFFDADGAEVEPLGTVVVTIASPLLEGRGTPLLVHVDDEAQGAGQAVPGAQVVEPLGADELERRGMSLDADECAFEADGFSTYVIVVTTLRQTLTASDGNSYRITVDCPAAAGIPVGAGLLVREVPEASRAYYSYLDQAEEALGAEQVRQARFFDITIVDATGTEIQPQAPVEVRVELDDAPAAEQVRVLHFAEGEAQPELMDTQGDGDAVTFDTEGFSVYGVVYTVDFHWSVNGRSYDFSIPGGGFVSLQQLAEVLGIADGAAYEPDDDAPTLMLSDVAVSDRTRDLVADVASVSFSSPELVWVGKVDEATTVGALKESHSLDCQYSAGLTRRQIREINAQQVEAGDWALISLLPFTSDETLTVTMGDGSQWTVQVTDAQLKKTVIAASGEAWDITVTYGAEAEIPEGSELVATEVLPMAEYYDAYVSEAERTLGWEAGSAQYARVFDITIVGPDGTEVQPVAPVQVSATLQDAQGNATDFSVVHFGAEPESLDADTDGNVVSFDTSGFSAYAIVQGPSAVPVGWVKLGSLAALRSKAADGLYIGTTSGYYLTGATAPGSSDRSTTGIVKTKPAQDYPADGAVKYYFEPVEGTDAQFYVYCLDGEARRYVRNTGNANLFLVDEAERTAFTVLVDNNGRFRFQNGNRYWNMWNGANGNHIAAWTTPTDTNNYFYLWDYTSTDSDPFGLHDKAYGLMFWNDGLSGKALMATPAEGNAQALAAKDLTVMAKKNSNGTKLFVPSDSDIALWTFEWVSQDRYYLKTVADGSTKYLSVSGSGVGLVSEPDDSCAVQVVPGSGTHAGELCLRVGNRTLTYSGVQKNGFDTGGKTGSEWLRLVELSELTADYVMTYSAEKVGVSDRAHVENGSRVIVYTRSWNDQTKKYEFYAIDHDGSLVRCYESGDDIQWIAGRINTMLWNFVEYTDDAGAPTYFYELYNQYSERYVAPQVTGGQLLSDATIGINMNGRRNGQYYTPIVAWDEDNYSYAALKVEKGRVVSCPVDEADDFYFAVMKDIPVDDELHTVPTVDHTQYGITMKIVDFATRKELSDYLGNDAYTNGNTTAGLLSTNLGEDGYPTAKGGSLAPWFAGAREVNHLFIDSTFRGTGYYEYDSTQNFAHLDGSDFTVYQELGTMDGSGSGKFYTHGQFMPFNDIEAGVFSSVNTQNTTAATGVGLPNEDPRKYERLYLVKNPNYYNGVELEASFVQTPDGLDDWGHDIIYEFTGDDDFWLYVDGELIIDLGGIHDALPGSVNYATGDVYVNGRHTTLRALFEKNYRTRNPQATQADVNAYLGQYFDEGTTVFKDYSSHTMKIFYLERGAGASNLHMRFNLASVKPGTVQLSKALSGVDATESVLAEFPYQIRYRTGTTESFLKNHVAGTADTTDYVFYKGTTTPVPFAEQFTVDGITYENVFFLKPGETAEISFPTVGEAGEVDGYAITECGVNTDIYQSVTVNGTTLDGTPVSGHQNRRDYAIGWATTTERAGVSYTNEVNPEALRTLTFTKRLFKEDGVTSIDHASDDTTFGFRLYLGTEFGTSLPLANMHTYHVRDAAGNYCTWDATQRAFVSLGKDDYAALTAQEQAASTFHTSMNGYITKIPVDYTVEVREVLAGTRFRVQERPWEIPDGYSFQKYVYNGTDYLAATTDELVDAQTGVTETVVSRQDPHVDICNLKGWGLRVNKVWSDRAYMSSRVPVWFAIYLRSDGADGAEELRYVDGTLRQLPYRANPQTLYWYFPRLPIAGTTFDQYEIREVELRDGTPELGEDDVVTNADALAFDPIPHEGETRLEGTQKGETEASSFAYTVLYDKGATAADANVRVDTVTNNRPGIVLRKTNWGGLPLAGAQFTLEDSAGTLIGTFTSDEEGQITVAFLREGERYVLTETKTPQGYFSLPSPLTLTLSQGAVSVDGVDEDWYDVEQGELPTVTIKNRPYVFEARKVDGDTGAAMKGVTFALHRQVTVDGVTSVDVNPMPGYEKLVTDVDGVIPLLDNTLPAGTYELREKGTPRGYQPLSDYIRFTVSPSGGITLAEGAPTEVTVDESLTENGSVCTMRIRNYIDGKLTLKKANERGGSLTGAKFQLCKYATSWETVSGYEEIDLTAASEVTLEKLSVGRYRLLETVAPDGYVIMDKCVYFSIAPDGTVALTDEEGTGPNANAHASLKGTTLTVQNVAGAALPASGGRGTAPLSALGALMAGAAVLLLVARRRPTAC